MKKHFITGVVVGGLLFGTAGAFAGQYVATENPFPVVLNGQNVSVEGYNIEGSTYFKLRDIADVVGGFEVGFDNNTIQLAKDGYSYAKNNSSSNTVTKTDGISYYSEKPWCPDFGAFTGAKLIRTNTTDNGTIHYVYDALTGTDHTKYFDLILEKTNLTLNPFSQAGFLLFENLETNHTVSYVLSKELGTVAIVVE